MEAWVDYHSQEEKTLLNGTVIAAGQTAEQDLKAALDNLFLHANVGPFISHQLIQRLVTSNPSPQYIERVTSVFNDNGQSVRGDLGAVVKAILLDNEARHIASPLQYFASLAQWFGATSSGLTDLFPNLNNFTQHTLPLFRA
jgi:uncharacterized protein (DUF1800 family)